MAKSQKQDVIYFSGRYRQEMDGSLKQFQLIIQITDKLHKKLKWFTKNYQQEQNC